MAREGQGYPCYQRDMMMMMMNYVDISQVVRNSTFRKIRNIILTTKNWKRNERFVKWETEVFNLQKSCIVERFSRCKGVTLEVKLVGRVKVFLIEK